MEKKITISKEAFYHIKKILSGIEKDDCELEYPKGGWWSTSTGAEFGTKKLQEIKDMILIEGP